jgi:hypothetical protein
MPENWRCDDDHNRQIMFFGVRIEVSEDFGGSRWSLVVGRLSRSRFVKSAEI